MVVIPDFVVVLLGVLLCSKLLTEIQQMVDDTGTPKGMRKILEERGSFFGAWVKSDFTCDGRLSSMLSMLK